MRWMMVVLALMTAAQANAATLRDKTEVIEEVASKLFESYKTRVTGKTVAVLQPKGSTSDFTDDERKQVRQRFISKIQANGYVVVDDDNLEQIKEVEAYQGSGAVKDSQVQQMGNKAGVQQIITLTFSEVVGRYDANEADVTLTVDMRATDVKTAKINIAKSVEVKYEHEIYHETYYARDSAAFGLGVAKWTTFVGACYYVVIGSNESTEAKKSAAKAEETGVTADAKANFQSDQEKHEKNAKSNYMWAGGMLGASILSWIFQSHLENLPRDTTDYHKYRLSAEPVRTESGTTTLALDLSIHF